MILLKDLGMLYPTESSKQKRKYGIYRCPKCNKKSKEDSYNIKKHNRIICVKCNKIEVDIKRRTHGMSYSKLYSIWSSMKKRCTLPSTLNFKYWGGKGISVCKEWDSSFTTFEQWSKENGYLEEMSLDRIDGNKNYTPNNCRWTTKFVQSQNQIIAKNNTSGYIGIQKSGNRWRARIDYNNENKSLGTFSTALDAAKARNTFIFKNNLEHTLNEV